MSSEPALAAAQGGRRRAQAVSRPAPAAPSPRPPDKKARRRRGRAAAPAAAASALFPPADLAGRKVVPALIWAAGLWATVVVGPLLLALWLAPVAAAAAAQAARSWKRSTHPHRPEPIAAFAAAALVTLAAPFGIPALIGAAIVATVGAAAWATQSATRRAGDAASGADVLLTLACAAVPAAAVVGPIELRAHGLVAALVVVSFSLVYDAAAWTMGAESRRRWVGPVCGMACILSVTVGVAAVFPQFKGDSAWVLGVVAAALAPLGPVAAGFLLGDRRVRAPALRRLDSLVVLGPLWALVAASLRV